MGKPRREVLFTTECLVLRRQLATKKAKRERRVSLRPPPGLGHNQGWGFRADRGGREDGVGSRSEPIANKVFERRLRVGRLPYDLG